MKHPLYVLLFAVLWLSTSLECQPQSRTKDVLNPAEARELITHDTSIVVLDVRTPQEFSGETGHLAGAILIPIQELDKRIGELDPYKSKTILAYCRTGHRSGQAQRLLKAHGFKVLNMAGGILKWNEEKLPVVKEDHP